MTTKRCTMCKAVFPTTSFNKRKRSSDGLQKHCRECNRRASRAYYARNRDKHVQDVWVNTQIYIRRNRELLLAHLESHPCVDCGETDVVVLEFDHVTGKKVREVTRMASYPVRLAVLREEIAKCDVRCVNCHRRKTAREQGTWRVRFNAKSPQRGLFDV